LQYERELPSPSTQTKFNYAWGLIKSSTRRDQIEGMRLLNEIHHDPDEQPRQRESLHYIALANFKLGDYLEARKFNDQLLAVEPNNPQARELERKIDERVTKEGLIGMAIVGTVVAGVAWGLTALLRRR